jgi:hypothetical protein
MNDQHRGRLSSILEEFAKLYPDWRFGQFVANVAVMARGPQVEAVWDVEDEEFLVAAESHLAQRRAQAAEATSTNSPSHLSRAG